MKKKTFVLSIALTQVLRQRVSTYLNIIAYISVNKVVNHIEASEVFIYIENYSFLYKCLTLLL